MSRVVWTAAASSAMARYAKEDPAGVNQILDSTNLLPGDPRPAGARRYAPDEYRIHVGRYRIWYAIRQNKPVIIEVTRVGRVA
ncbi:type II toxin-antitoxin system RelE/ParE family toxin [Streptomyces sp. LP05-1]|uniref:Type II toxin-antitoxin system RelE/ParE family toxin n=1 Tax=Streptomyces pyxinae TaxID=2970734 RepID=A0ABT2CR43_9ACTN|nr:type II toxin-antitoxin system RelE/ParE family toxin [Streptomyces sp. LP05-1]MCS0639903.1 type II toxin-antitoxin system RelE/ParE family toxin [Streptomyces sp. LP05-1]